VESPERAGQKQPGGQRIGGKEDAGGHKYPGGHDSQLPVPLMKNPERQPERKMSTALEASEVYDPPPQRAMFETEVAASQSRATLRDAVVHNPEVLLKMSTTLDGTLEKALGFTCPPPNRARFETEVAARLYRATLRDAVVHNPEVLLKISTTLDWSLPYGCPPPNMARFETDVAARTLRLILRSAVVHNPEVLLKISTTLDGPGPPPPPNRTMFETDVAARPLRATLRVAVVHTPEMQSKISTTLDW
jgi:hypothetical protein